MASAGPGVQNGPDITPVHEDPIRIVPLSVPDEMLRPVEGAAPAVAPQLTYRGGPLLTNVQVFTVFWGHAWANPPISDTASRRTSISSPIATSILTGFTARHLF